MKPANPRILTINGGSSSIKFALFEAGESLQRILAGGIDRIGQPEATLQVKGLGWGDNFSRAVKAPEYTEDSLLTLDYESGLHQHYNRPGYWLDEPVVKAHSH